MIVQLQQIIIVIQSISYSGIILTLVENGRRRVMIEALVSQKNSSCKYGVPSMLSHQAFKVIQFYTNQKT